MRTDYTRLRKAFARQFGWKSSDTETSLVFSVDGQSNSPETIVYEVKGHSGGVALLRMRVRLTGVSEDLSGNAMCWRTFAIVNASPS